GSIDIAHNLGVNGIDLYLQIYDYKDSNSVYSFGADDNRFIKHFEDIKKYADSKGVKICQTHGRSTPVIENDDEYNNVVFPKNAKLDLIASRILGSPICVFHPAGTLSNMNSTPEEMREKTFNAFKSILPTAMENGVKIAMETVGANHNLNDEIDFFGDFEEFFALYNRIEAIDNYKYKDYFSCCIDTGHVNLAVKHNQPTPAEFIKKMGKRVSCLHMHDNDGYRDQHRIISSGTINWEDVFSALAEIGYKGYYNTETYFGTISKTFMIETAEFSVKLIRHFLSLCE
ncbi:MAG: sugar phosphate isomerase/epimerase, partial [Clostridia bacterium]|nr:sugar phosphate isomerase/epimerase [Clostridia bacterium]